MKLAIVSIKVSDNFQVGRALQPSIIFIDDCERMFKKKIPKTDLVSRIINLKNHDTEFLVKSEQFQWEKLPSSFNNAVRNLNCCACRIITNGKKTMCSHSYFSLIQRG